MTQKGWPRGRDVSEKKKAMSRRAENAQSGQACGCYQAIFPFSAFSASLFQTEHSRCRLVTAALASESFGSDVSPFDMLQLLRGRERSLGASRTCCCLLAGAQEWLSHLTTTPDPTSFLLLFALAKTTAPPLCLANHAWEQLFTFLGGKRFPGFC